MILLAPKTLWAMVNLRGSVGGKYGAKTHFSTQRRRRILQAAQGLRTTAGGGGEEGWEVGGEAKLVAVEEEDIGEKDKGLGTVMGVGGELLHLAT